MIAAKSYETDVWQCPNCGSPISKSYKCIGCATQFSVEGCVVDLRPQNFEQVKHGEDAVFAEGSPELNKYRERPWMFIVGRKEITRFTNEIVDQLPSGRFLEIGGETCWAASLFKSIHPNSIVYGSDISPNSLRNAAIPVSKMFPSAPDYLVAADAESLPFADEVFDSIFATTMIHHLPNPSRMMDEVFRVLKPGGRFIAVDASVPKHFKWMFKRVADSRSSEWGIQEDLISFSRWQDLLRRSHIPVSALTVYTKPDYLYDPLQIIATKAIRKLPTRLIRSLFPVGVLISYEKPLNAS